MQSRRISMTVKLLIVVGGYAAMACGDDTGTPPIDTIRFGQVGEVEVAIVAPRFFGEGEGELQQILTWGSTGAWFLREIISYRGLVGDENVERNEGDPIAYASAYASLITSLHTETSGVRLVDAVAPMEDLACGATETRVTFTIWDDLRKQEKKWVRCARRTLARIQTSEAGPDLEAVRVIQAAILVRDFTQGPDFTSAYFGSVPFGTLDRSEESGAGLTEPVAFYSVPEGNPRPPTNWLTFWKDHNDTPAHLIPQVDWKTEMAIVAAVGLRREAGDSVEVRRILQTGEGTQVALFERVPGDFCSPASRDHYPVHVVVAPRTLTPILFSEVKEERVSCGE
jgi:hypothetical protein